VWAFVEPVADSQLEALLEASWSHARRGPDEAPRASLAQLDFLAEAARSADLAFVRPHLARAVRKLRGAGIALSDRRIGKAQALIAAAAVVAGRAAPTESDLWPIVYAIPSAEQQALARAVLRDVLEKSESSALSAAAEESSAGPRARATRLAAAAEEIFARPPEQADAAARDAWLLKLEGVAREIDSAFAPETLPDTLKAVRERIVASIGGGRA
jgi:MoxR-like ATPase